MGQGGRGQGGRERGERVTLGKMQKVGVLLEGAPSSQPGSKA